MGQLLQGAALLNGGNPSAAARHLVRLCQSNDPLIPADTLRSLTALSLLREGSLLKAQKLFVAAPSPTVSARALAPTANEHPP